MEFINSQLRSNIKYVIKEMFPNIILDDINFLFSCMIGLINVVNQCHFREEYNIDEYRIKLTQNNNRYIKCE